MRFPKILLLKGPLDGHDRPIYDLIRLLRAGRLDPIWVGLQQSWSAIIKTAVEEDVDAIGASVHAGDPVMLLEHLKSELDRAGLTDVVLAAGGSGEITFPDVRERLESLGFKIFLSSADRRLIAEYFAERTAERERSLRHPARVPAAIESRRELAVLLSAVERRSGLRLSRGARRAPAIVFSGPAGAGKSSALDAVLRRFSGPERIGVVLCDPRGPFERGAYLGDRIVLQDHATREELFIRSVSQPGGYNEANVALIRRMRELFSRWGASVVFIETIGLGQEGAARIKAAADCFVWLAPPNETDADRLAKGGPHELADCIVLTKTDIEAPFRAEAALRENFAGPSFSISAKTGDGIEAFAAFLKEKIASGAI